MWYDINYNKLVVLLLPTFLRKPKTVAFLRALVAPIAQIHEAFLLKRDSDFYNLNHNGQVCYLRKALNDRFDPSQRRIYIGEGYTFFRKYIYTKGEKKPYFLGNMYLNQNEDFADTGVDFIVFVPQAIQATQHHQLNALIQFYKLASKRYKIEPIL